MWLKWRSLMLLFVAWRWSYLALSKVADGVFPMAPNPTPTAKPSVNETRVRLAGDGLFFRQSYKAKRITGIVTRVSKHTWRGRGLVCGEYSKSPSETAGEAPSGSPSPLTSRECYLKRLSSRMEKVTRSMTCLTNWPEDRAAIFYLE